MSEREDEFYIGWMRDSPSRTAARTRGAVLLLLGLGVLVACLAASGQGAFDRGTFEYGVERDFEGLLIEQPYPLLVVPPADGATRPTTHYLVDFGKRGAADRVTGLDGRIVRLTGSAIHNDSQHMIEVHRVEPVASPAAALAAFASAEEQSLGTWTLAGEIVDSKCHLGVMKPGRGRPHKECAVRCISGGIPPVLRVTSPDGRAVYLSLVGDDGRAVNGEVLQWVAEPVEITGRVVRTRGLLVLYAEPSTYRHVPS
jgi:hypothetical protein